VECGGDRPAHAAGRARVGSPACSVCGGGRREGREEARMVEGANEKYRRTDMTARLSNSRANGKEANAQTVESVSELQPPVLNLRLHVGANTPLPSLANWHPSGLVLRFCQCSLCPNPLRIWVSSPGEFTGCAFGQRVGAEEMRAPPLEHQVRPSLAPERKSHSIRFLSRLTARTRRSSSPCSSKLSSLPL